MKPAFALCLLLLSAVALVRPAFTQEKKPDRIRIGGGAASASQMPLWFAVEAGLYKKYGIDAEAINIPGSSLLAQTMLSGEVPIGQMGGPAPVLAALSGGDFVIVATIIKNFVFYIFARPGIEKMEDLRGKALGTTRVGTLSHYAARFALEKYGLDPERDVTVLQTSGQPETVAALAAGRVQAAALTAPATIRARQLGFKPLLDVSKLDANFHVNGVVTTRRYMKSNEDVVRRFLKAYVEGMVLAKKDKAFAVKAMGKYFKSDDKEMLEESYNWIVRDNFSIPPYPAMQGVATILHGAEKTNPKAVGARVEDFADGRFIREMEQSGFIKSILP